MKVYLDSCIVIYLIEGEPMIVALLQLSPVLRYARFLTPLLSKTPDSQN